MRRTGRGAISGLFVLALASFVMLGLADGALGVAWPSIRSVFGRGLSELGALLAFASIGYLLASTAYGRIDAALGTGRSLAVGAALMATGLAGIAAASGWAVVAASAATLGVGGGLVDAGMNAHAALEFDVGSINLLHACYGVGATVGPLLIAASLEAGAAWRGGYVIMMAGQVGVASLLWRTRRRWAVREQEMLAPSGPLSSRGAGMLVIFFLYTGVEVATGQWGFTLLSEGRGLSTAVAGAWVAAYWGGLTAGRVVIGLLGSRLRPSQILDWGVGTALAGLTLLWWDPGGGGAAGLPLAGLGFAGVFPTLVSLTPARIGRPDSTRMIGYQLAAANVGVATVPWALGLGAEGFGVGALGPGLFAAGALFAGMHIWSGRGRSRIRETPRSP